MNIKLTVLGRPVPQSRPRIAMRGKRAHAYEAGRIVEWKETMLSEMKSVAPPEKMTAPIMLVVHAFFVRPPGQLSKKTGLRLKGFQPVPYPNSYDVDNLAKPVMDCATKAGWWDDDGAVQTLEVSKHYGAEFGIVIEATEMEINDK